MNRYSFPYHTYKVRPMAMRSIPPSIKYRLERDDGKFLASFDTFQDAQHALEVQRVRETRAIRGAAAARYWEPYTPEKYWRDPMAFWGNLGGLLMIVDVLDSWEGTPLAKDQNLFQDATNIHIWVSRKRGWE